MALQGFNEDYYLEAKLAALQADPLTAADWAGKDTAFLADVLGSFGFTPESHYQQYGWAEGLAPNSSFNAAEYTLAKATAMFNEGGYWTVAAAQADFEALWPYDTYLHYLSYGAQEDINPSNAFDESAYLESKLAALQADPETADEWADKTVEDLRAAFDDASLSAVGHYEAYGRDEGILVTEVPPEDQVDPDQPAGIPGDTFILTTGQDNIVGTVNDDLVTGIYEDNSGDTLTLGDKINGGSGADTLKIFSHDDELDLSKVEISNIDNFIVNNSYDDFDTLNIAGNDFDLVTVDYDGTSNYDSLYIDNINGETNLVIENVSSYDYTFYRNYDEVYDTTEGLVSVSNTIRNIDTAPNDYYLYYEGYNYFSDATEINHTLTVENVNGRDEGIFVYEYIGTEVDGAVINTTVNITDVDVPDYYSGVYVYVENETDEASDITAVVNITDSDGVDFEFDTYSSGDSGDSDEITYNIDNFANTYDDNYLYTYGFETINLNVLSDSEVYGFYDGQTDGNDQTINIVADGDFTVTDYTEFDGDVGDVTLNVSGAGDVDLDYTYLGDGDAIDTVIVDASAMTGDFTIDEYYGYAASVTSGSGDDSITVGGYETAVTTNDGDDTVDTNGYDFGDVDAEELDGGAGTDTIAIDDGANLDAAAAANISNFEVLDFSFGTGTYDMAIEESLKDVTATGAIAAAVDIDSLTDDIALTLNAFDDTDAITLLAEDGSGASDALALNLNAIDTDKDLVIEGETSAVVVAAEYESVSIASNATTASVAAPPLPALTPADYTNTLDLDAIDMTDLVIAGNAMAEVIFTDATALTLVDATANEAGVTIDASVGGIVAGLTLDGSDAADSYIATANGDLIQANGGADLITLGGGDDTVRLYEASDSQVTLVDTDDPADDEADVAKGYDAITDFNAAGIDLIELSDNLGLATGDARADMLQLGAIASTGDFPADLEAFIGDGVGFFDTGVVDRATAHATYGGNGYLFVDANSDGDFTQADDMMVELTGVTALAITDITFG